MNTDRDWQIWGETDPYYGVASAPEFRRDVVDVDHFLGTGEAYVATRLALVEQHLGPVARGRALDFGCGVGRLSFPLATRFGEVIGLDVSPGMLAEAEQLKARHGIANADFLRSDDALSQATGRFDLVQSFIVLQHIPATRGLPIIDRLLQRVAQGGVADLHFVIGRGDTPLRALFYRLRTRVPGVQNMVHGLRGKRASEPMMQMNEYPASAVFTLFHRCGFGRLLVDVVPHGRFLTMHVAARRETVGEEVA